MLAIIKLGYKKDYVLIFYEFSYDIKAVKVIVT